MNEADSQDYTKHKEYKMNDVDASSKMNNEINDVNNFARLCARTSPTDLAPIKERLENRSIEYELITISERLITLIRKLDDIKKFAFYGKQSAYIDNVLRSSMESVALSQYNDKNIRIVHSILGATTESGELLEILVNHLRYNNQIDDVNFVEELSDISWYIAEGSQAVNVPMSKIHSIVIEKLKKRYPDKYSDEKAIVRDLKVERNLLEESMRVME